MLQVFVELDELISGEWKETARWIKFEEDVEESQKWGKPRVASLSFHSLLELRKTIERGIRCSCGLILLTSAGTVDESAFIVRSGDAGFREHRKFDRCCKLGCHGDGEDRSDPCRGPGNSP